VGGLGEVKLFLVWNFVAWCYSFLGSESMAGSCTSQRDNVSINTVAIDILHYIPTAAMSSHCYRDMTPC